MKFLGQKNYESSESTIEEKVQTHGAVEEEGRESASCHFSIDGKYSTIEKYRKYT